MTGASGGDRQQAPGHGQHEDVRGTALHLCASESVRVLLLMSMGYSQNSLSQMIHHFLRSCCLNFSKFARLEKNLKIFVCA